MQIDPVIPISEELRRAETLLVEARTHGDDAFCRRLLAEISILNERLFGTTPTSTPGAAEILGRVSQLLTGSFAHCAARMNVIAERFAQGRRSLTDLLWLRAIARDMADGLYGEEGLISAKLVAAAIAGASRPVLVFRASPLPIARRRRRTGP